MGFHHVALCTLDLEATHRFYTEAMGFELAHVEDGETEVAGGWFRHVLYDTGNGELLAFMDLHDERRPNHDLSISRGVGLPSWVNHLAFGVEDLDGLDAARDRWLAHGVDVVRMQHNHGVSIYTDDPNGNVVEWSCQTRPYGDVERRAALARLRDPDLPRDVPTHMEFFLAADFVRV
jgi:catechol 2,3-dioxygenase-like lactoylglutathione lyase family enzyme